MDESKQNSVTTDRDPVQSRSTLLFVAIGIFLLVVLVTGFYVLVQKTPGTRMVYEIDHASIDDGATAQDVVQPLQRRLDDMAAARAMVQRLGPNQVEVVVLSQDQTTVRDVKQLIESTGLLRFLIIANPVDHAQLINAATTKADSDSADSNSRDVLDPNGTIIGRWVTVSREDAVTDFTRPLRVDVSHAIVRDHTTGRIVSLPADVRQQDAQRAIAMWIDRQGMEALDVLTVIDPDLEVRGSDLSFAAMTFDENGNPAIAMTFTDDGASRFFALTTINSPVGGRTRQLGIVLDDKLLSAPNILAPIRKEARITGDFTPAEVELIVRILKAGQLPVGLGDKPISETHIDVPSPLAELF